MNFYRSILVRLNPSKISETGDSIFESPSVFPDLFTFHLFDLLMMIAVPRFNY